jgi:hypothetical protein
VKQTTAKIVYAVQYRFLRIEIGNSLAAPIVSLAPQFDTVSEPPPAAVVVAVPPEKTRRVCLMSFNGQWPIQEPAQALTAEAANR